MFASPLKNHTSGVQTYLAEAHRVDDTQSDSFWRNHTDAFPG